MESGREDVLVATVASHDRAPHAAPATAPPDDDGEAVAALRLGDMAGLDRLFARHAGAVFNYLYRRCGSREDAADLTSSTFLTAWQARSRAALVDDTALPWLYRIATNTLSNHQRTTRRRERRERSVTNHAAATTPDPADGVVEGIDDRRRIAQVRTRLASLPSGYADVFYLVFWQELSYQQAAAALSIPVGTVRSRVARVRQALSQPDPTPRRSPR